MPSPRQTRSRSRSRDRHDRERRRSASPRRRKHETHSRSRSRSRDRDRRRERSKSREHDRDSDRRHRPRSRSRSMERGKRDKDKTRRRSRSRSRGRLSGASGSDSDSEYEARRKRKKDKHKRKSSRSRERKDRKREKKERKKKKTGVVGGEWGKHGLINESDFYNKSPEFHAWLVEERMINPESISKDQSKKEFARFVEDFNTATLPNDKYYNIEVYERRMNALRSGELLPPTDMVYDPNADMRALQSQHRRRDVDKESYLSREQLEELRRVQNERVQLGKMKAMGMDIKQNMGVRMDGTSFDD